MLAFRGGDQSRGKAGCHKILGKPPREAEGCAHAGAPRCTTEQRAGDGASDAGQRPGLGRGAAPGEHPTTDCADREPDRE
ncbi:hypothetical protein MEX01_48820 [Methylorubrum extorquens]|nr:hypothetical protein MEX01_48820 [Methylorubrum extorquens]